MSKGSDLMANAMRQQARAAMSDMAWPEIATISSYDASNHAVKVLIQPEGEESNWMPLGAIGIGNGWGVAVGPQIGDQVLVVFELGDASSGTIVGRIFSTAQQAIAVPSGEIWAVHSTGSFLKLVTSGDIDVSTAGNLNAIVAGNMTATITGNATISAKAASIVAAVSAAITAPAITLGASGQALMAFITSAFESLFNGHTHLSNGTGNQTNVPTQQMGPSHMTSTTLGG